MAPLIKEFQKNPESFNIKVCVTAQHRELLDQVLSIFEIIPDYDLNIMKAGQDLFEISSRVLLGVRDVLSQFCPDFVLVHGDTTTSTASALAAFYQRIPVGHVEAGLRTHNIYSPWPEEMNRQITSRLATIHFAPTISSCENLLAEGIDKGKIRIVGNTVIDALFLALNMLKQNPRLKLEIKDQIILAGFPNLNLVEEDKRRLILVTGHRRENFGEGFISICEALKGIAEENPDFDVVYPVHLNPNVQKPVYEILGNISNIFLLAPQDYLPFIYLMEKSYIILTDSGGIQEEAPSLGRPVLVMRDTTERPEAVDSGTVKLVGVDKQVIVREINNLINSNSEYEKMSNANNPYGDGNTSKLIVKYFLEN